RDALSADGLRAGGNLYLSDGFHAEGEVALPGAQIRGQLICSGGTFLNAGNNALNADNIDIGTDFLLDNGVHVEGGVTAAEARIGGAFSCWGGSFTKPKRSPILMEPRFTSLSLKGSKIQGDIYLVSQQWQGEPGSGFTGLVDFTGLTVEG